MRFGCELADWRFVRLNVCVTRRCLVVLWVVPVSPWVSWVWFGPVPGVFSTRRCLRVFPMVLWVFVWVGVACGPVLV